jgi:hypothetical protein
MLSLNRKMQTTHFQPRCVFFERVKYFLSGKICVSNLYICFISQVMLISIPVLDELYRKSCALAEDIKVSL